MNSYLKSSSLSGVLLSEVHLYYMHFEFIQNLQNFNPLPKKSSLETWQLSDLNWQKYRISSLHDHLCYLGFKPKWVLLQGNSASRLICKGGSQSRRDPNWPAGCWSCLPPPCCSPGNLCKIKMRTCYHPLSSLSSGIMGVFPPHCILIVTSTLNPVLLLARGLLLLSILSLERTSWWVLTLY